MYADISMDDKFQIESGYDPHDKYRHSSIYAVNVGTHMYKNRGKRKPRKLRLLSSTKGEENRIE